MDIKVEITGLRLDITGASLQGVQQAISPLLEGMVTAVLTEPAEPADDGRDCGLEAPAADPDPARQAVK